MKIMILKSIHFILLSRYIKIEDDYDLDKTLDENYDELMRSIGTV